MVQKLRGILKEHILRRTKKQLKEECNLPERNEYIVPCKMTDEQFNLYEAYIKDIEKIMRSHGNFQLSDKNTKHLFYTVIS
jgi:SNF2 family DNA or RNA helicase